jgi:hypothetical protein
MEQKKNNITTTQIGLRYGLIYGLVAIVLAVMEFLLDNKIQTLTNILSTVAWLFFIVWGVKTYKESKGGFLMFGEGFGIGLIVSVVGNLLSGLFLVVYSRYLNPAIWERQLERMRETWEKQGLNEEAINQAEKWVTPEAMLMMGVLGALILGSIFSVIIAAIMQKKKPEF